MDLYDIWLSLRLLAVVVAYTIAATFSFFGSIWVAILLQEILGR